MTVLETCPRCRGLLLADREDGAACFACGWRPRPKPTELLPLVSEIEMPGYRRPKHGKVLL